MEEKKEFFQREDIRTMSKDIAQAREQEAAKERERISSLKTKEEAEAERKRIEEKEEWSTPTPLAVPPTAPPPPYEKIPFPPAAKPSGSEKLLIRIGIILILILVFANMFLFWYWYLREEKMPQAQPPAEQEQLEEVKPPEEIPEEKEEAPGIVPTPSLIPIEATSFLQTTSTENLVTKVSQALEAELGKGYTRVLIQNTEQNKILGLKEFFEGLAITAPDGFYEKLAHDFTLFIFSQAQGNRLGFVAKITEKQGLAELLKSWEITMESDFETLFSLLGKEGPALVSYFKVAPYKGATLSYQTFSRDDLGICYSVLGDYFVWTSSWESLLKTIDKLSE